MDDSQLVYLGAKIPRCLSKSAGSARTGKSTNDVKTPHDASVQETSLRETTAKEEKEKKRGVPTDKYD